jgi:hypothetical protein
MSKQSRAYNGIDYSRCKSAHDLIGAIGQAIKENDMEFELMRQTDTEPRDLKEWSKQGAKEDAR